MIIEIDGIRAKQIAHDLGKMWDAARTSVVWANLAKRSHDASEHDAFMAKAHYCNGTATGRSFDVEREIAEALRYEREIAQWWWNKG